jgi:serine/threonine-protein kinase HipA
VTDQLVVLIGQRVAGTLSRDPSRRTELTFEYDEEYRYGPDPTPLSLSMPIQTPAHASDVITPWLWGLLPDNTAVLDRWARAFQISGRSPYGFLATPVGEDCAGAVRFVDPARLEEVRRRSGSIDWLDDDAIAARIATLRADATAWLGNDLTGHFSLAGAQAKTALHYRDGRWGVPSGDLPTTHILKPAIRGLDEHDLNEHLCLSAARTCGLIAASSAILHFGDERVVAIERFDRFLDDSGRMLRAHQEDLCQALAYPPDRKYQAEGGPGAPAIAGLLRDSIVTSAVDADLVRFADALIYNWLIGATDAHAKNYAVLLSGSRVRLAPLYDIGSALPYPGMHPRKLRLAMKLGGSYLLSPSGPGIWPKVAAELSLPADLVRARAQRLAGRVPDALHAAAADPAVTSLGSDLPARLLDAVAARVKACAATLS